MKIRKLEIQHYKIFDDVSLDFTDKEGKTLSTVVLAGMNGCGKTTILDLLSDFFTGFLYMDGQSNIRIEIELTPEEQLKYSEGTIFPASEKLRKTIETGNISNALIFRLNGKEEVASFSHIIGFRFKIQALFPGVHFVYFPTNPTTTKESYKTESPFSTILSMDPLIGTMKESALKSLRDEIIKNRDIPPRESIEKHISNITKSLANLGLNTRLVDLESEELIFESANGQRIYFEQLSHGEQHLYFRAIYLSQLNLKDAVIMIDEPEAAFHPSWQQKVAELYSNVGENNQVFLATHSPHVMASVPPESLFVLDIDTHSKKITAINMGKAGKHSQGVEPNRILMEIMQVNTLRDYQTQVDINTLSELLTPEKFETEEATILIEKLTEQLGRQDPFIMRMEHRVLMLTRKKQSLPTVA